MNKERETDAGRPVSGLLDLQARGLVAGVQAALREDDKMGFLHHHRVLWGATREEVAAEIAKYDVSVADAYLDCTSEGGQ